MKKVIREKTIYFYDDNDVEIMYIDFPTDECIWQFNSDSLIKITPDMELHGLLSDFMNQEYMFPVSILKNYKDQNTLVWYSDCYYNPDDEWSVASVSCLHIEKTDDCFDIWCTKALDEIINRPHKTYCICFSPCGNGNYNKNLTTGSTLQTDFVTHIYQPLLSKEKQKSKKKPIDK